MPQTCQIRTHAPQQAASLLVSLIADGIGPKNRFSNKGAPGVDGQDFGFFPGHSSHILIRCSTRRSTIRRATDCLRALIPYASASR